MKRGPIVRHYLRTWFFFDLIATFPYSWFLKERIIDYWPDDGFDEIAEEKNRFSTLIEVNRAVALSEFDLP